MKTHKLLHWYTTVGPIGYFPASGTIATLITTLVLYFFSSLFALHAFSILLLSSWCAYVFINKIVDGSIPEDPSEIVIDEVIGCLITFYAIPLSLVSMCFGFLLFRFFDITKIGPVGWMEKLPGASGILLDDIMAGIISNLLLRLLISYVF